MESKKNFIIFAVIIIAVIIAGFGGWYIYRDLKKPSPENNQPTIDNKTISPDEIKKQMPDLDREIIIKGNINEETKDTAIEKIKEITAQLKEDYDRREEWLNLGIWRKTLGDYEGAEQAWKFVTLIRPNDPIAFHNLGDLYSQYLVDFQKAEKFYLLAIEKNPEADFFYLKLFEFYRYFLKRPDLAENILVEGIKKVSDSSTLKTALEAYRKEK
jgi:tetratricopeptide (TPR) repeat protein